MVLNSLPTLPQTATQHARTSTATATRATHRSQLLALVGLPTLVMGSALALIHARAETQAFVEHWHPTITQPAPIAMPQLRDRSAQPEEQPTSEPVATPVAAPAEAPTEAAVVSAVTANAAQPEATSETIEVSGWGSGDWESGWAWDEAGWRSRWATYMQNWRAAWMRRRWAAIAPAVAQLRMIRSAMIEEWMSSNANMSLDNSMLENANSCGVFSCVWTPSASRSSRSTVPARTAAVTVNRSSRGWQLIGSEISLTIRDGAACAVSVVRGTNAPETVVIDTPHDDTTVASCTVTAEGVDGSEGTPRLMVRWSGENWSQTAEISLANATQPQAFITRTRSLADGTTQHQLTNLSQDHHSWTFGGRDIDTAPGDVVQLRSNELPH